MNLRREDPKVLKSWSSSLLPTKTLTFGQSEWVLGWKTLIEDQGRDVTDDPTFGWRINWMGARRLSLTKELLSIKTQRLEPWIDSSRARLVVDDECLTEGQPGRCDLWAGFLVEDHSLRRQPTASRHSSSTLDHESELRSKVLDHLVFYLKFTNKILSKTDSWDRRSDPKCRWVAEVWFLCYSLRTQTRVPDQQTPFDRRSPTNIY